MAGAGQDGARLEISGGEFHGPVVMARSVGSVQVPTRPATADYVFAAVAGAVLLALGVFLGVSGSAPISSSRARSVAAVACVCLAPLLVAALVARRRRELRKLLVVVPEPGLADSANRLGDALKAQYRREEELGRIGDPMPLTVRWTPAATGLGDHAANLAAAGTDPADRAATAGGAAPNPSGGGPIRLEGEFQQVVEQYRRLPRGRLVVLGAPGAGKSALVLRLARQLLENRRESEPVPVVLPLASWNPRAQPLLWWWAAGALAEAHPAALTAPGVPRRAVAHQLLTSGRVLPVLDGFDELPERLRVTALRQLRESLGDSGRLVLTSRSKAYTAAVEEGDLRLPGMAAVELRHLHPGDVRAYLTASARPLSRGGEDGVHTKWDPVLARIDDRADTTPEILAVRAVLRTPLMVTLARAVYSDTAADPAELLPPKGFRSPRELERHLLGGYVNAAYAPDSAAVPVPVPGAERRWTAGEARRWLGELALRQRVSEQQDISWWHLDRMVPRRARLTFALLLPALWAAMVALAGVPQTVGSLRLPVPMWLLVLVGGLAALLADWYSVSEPQLPVPQRVLRPTLRVARGLLRRRVQRVGAVLACLTVTVQWVLAAGFGGGWEAPAVCTAALLAMGLIGLRNAVRVPAEPEEHAPEELLRGDRRAALVLAPVALPGSPLPLPLQKAGLATVLAAVVLWDLRQSADSVLGGRWVALALLLAAGVAVWSCTVSAWGRFCAARLWLAASGTLPLRLTEFLQGAHERGVLRRTGGSYQFRHLELQNELADEAARRRGRAPGHAREDLGGLNGSDDLGDLDDFEDFEDFDEETLRMLRRREARQEKVIVGGAGLVALTVGFAMLGGAVSGPLEDGPVKALPPACKLLGAQELRPALQDPVAVPMKEATNPNDALPRSDKVLQLAQPLLKDSSTCAYVERAPFRPAATVTVGVGYVTASTSQTGTAWADQWARQSWGTKPEPVVRGLGDAGTVAESTVTGDDLIATRFTEQPRVPMGLAHVRAGNALVTVDISREFSKPAQLREAAQLIAATVLRNAGLMGPPAPKARTLADLPQVDLPRVSRFGIYDGRSVRRIEGAVWQGHERSRIAAFDLGARLWLSLRLPPGATCPDWTTTTGAESARDGERHFRCTARTPDGPVTVDLVAYGCDNGCTTAERDAFYERRPGPGAGTWPRHDRATRYRLDGGADGTQRAYLVRHLRTWWRALDTDEKKSPFDYFLWMRVTAPEGHGETAEKVMNDAFTQQPPNGR